MDSTISIWINAMETATSTMAMDMHHIMDLVILITLNLDTIQATSRSTINLITISQATGEA